MSCLDEEILYKFLDNVLKGKKREEVEKHLSECKICQKKVNELRAFDNDLKLFWKEYRKKCPSPETMYEYSLGRLSKEDMKKMSKHLESCHICKMKYEESERMAEELEKLAATETKEKIPEIALPEEKKKVLKKLTDVFNLAKKSKSIMDQIEKFWKSHFSFDKSVGLKILKPSFGMAYEMADIGEGYEKEGIQEEDSPFQVEIVQFGKQVSIILNTEVELFKNSIVKFQLYEKEESKYSGVLFVSEGTGRYKIDLEEEDFKRPENEPYKIKLDAMSYVDLLVDIKEPKSSKMLDELMKSEDPEIKKLISGILDKKENSGTKN